MKKIIDLSGQQFGDWTVIKLDHNSPKYDKYWLCQCVCGVEKAVIQHTLKSGASTNCGCKYRKRSDTEQRIMQKHALKQFLKSPRLDKKANRNNQTGVRNVNLVNGLYAVIITRDGITYRKYHQTLAEAVRDKKRVLLRYESGAENWATKD